MPDVKISDLPLVTAAAADMQVEVMQGGGNFRLSLSTLMVSAATLSAAGLVELATQAETDSGQDANRVVTPATLAGRLATHRPQPPMGRRELASSATLAAADCGAVVDCSGNITLSVSWLPEGWWCHIGNVGVGDIVIAASDGLQNWLMYPGERRLFYQNSGVLRSVVLRPFRRRWLVSGPFVKPPGYLLFGRAGSGAGGGGASGGRASSGAGGGGGVGGETLPAALSIVSAADLPATVSVLVGAGGLGAAGVTTDATEGGLGGAGGNTSFGGLIIPGGRGGYPYYSGVGRSGWASGVGIPGGLGGYGGSSTQGVTAGESVLVGNGGGGGGGRAGVATATNVAGAAGGIRASDGAASGGNGGGAAGNAGGSALLPGYGGGGGGGGDAGAAGNGGNGGLGAGGGGGGGSFNGYLSGAGGRGGDGWFEIWGIV